MRITHNWLHGNKYHMNSVFLKRKRGNIKTHKTEEDSEKDYDHKELKRSSLGNERGGGTNINP